MIRRFENWKIGRFVVGAAAGCFLALSSFQQIVQKPNYKTLRDTSFQIGDHVLLPAIYFDLNKSTLMQNANYSGRDTLTRIYDFLTLHKNLVVEIGNHTDRSCDYCDSKPTQQRATTIVDSLRKQGILPKRLIAKGYGESAPFCTDKTVILPSGTIIEKGTWLTDIYVKKIAPIEHSDDRQFLNQMNRRTEMIILETDFIPTSGN